MNGCRRFSFSFAPILFFAFSALATNDTFVDTMHTRNGIQGLAEVKAKAEQFIKAENKKSSTKYVVLEPNNKVFLPECVVPLRAKWNDGTWGERKPAVHVFCDKTLHKFDKGFTWRVLCPVRLEASKPSA